MPEPVIPNPESAAVETVPVAEIAQAILMVRGHKLLLDSDLAALYGVPTKRLNEQVRRNSARFPGDFVFRLTRDETEALNRSQIATGSASHAPDTGADNSRECAGLEAARIPAGGPGLWHGRTAHRSAAVGIADRRGPRPAGTHGRSAGRAVGSHDEGAAPGPAPKRRSVSG